MIELRLSALKESRPSEYLLRFLFGGLCTALAGIIAKKWGAEIGGLFLAFPAIFPAGVSLIESHERRRKREIGSDGTRRGRIVAGIDATGSALGCIGLALFALTVWKLLPRHGGVSVITLACLIWAAAALLLWECRKRRFFARRRA